jgi:hypothetical protein
MLLTVIGPSLNMDNPLPKIIDCRDIAMLNENAVKSFWDAFSLLVRCNPTRSLAQEF